MIRVLVVDDEPIVRSGIALLLAGEAGIEVIGDVDGTPEVIDLVRTQRPDVVIADVRMPGLDGVELTRRIVDDPHRTGDPPKVLVLTTFHVDDAVFAALRAGATGFVLKDAAPHELVAAVRAVAFGEGWLDPAVARQLIDEFAAHRPSTLPGPPELRALTPREREVLVLIAHGLSNAEISDHLVVGEGTTKTHITRIFAKLGLRDRAQAVAMAYKCGLLRPEDPIPARRD